MCHFVTVLMRLGERVRAGVLSGCHVWVPASVRTSLGTRVLLYMCVREWHVCIIPSACMWRGRSLGWKAVLASQVPSQALSSWEQLWPPDPELGTSGLGKKVSSWFLFTFLKCTCGSHLSQRFQEPTDTKKRGPIVQGREAEGDPEKLFWAAHLCPPNSHVEDQIPAGAALGGETAVLEQVVGGTPTVG